MLISIWVNDHLLSIGESTSLKNIPFLGDHPPISMVENQRIVDFYQHLQHHHWFYHLYTHYIHLIIGYTVIHFIYIYIIIIIIIVIYIYTHDIPRLVA